MVSIAIDRFKARYRLPLAALDEQPRMQRIVNDALTRVLEGAVEREGIGPAGYVCIRDLHAVTMVRLHEPDAALADGVGHAIAVAIRRVIDEGSASVVQYRSRAHALVDLASRAISGDFSRSWAWIQVGIWRADFPLRPDVTADLVVRALAREPTHAVAVAAYLARARAERFGELIARATSKGWEALARAAFLAAGGAVNAAARGTEPAPGPRTAIDLDRRERLAEEWESVAHRVAARSAIARGSIGRLAHAPAEVRSALAVLALLEVEPSAVRGGRDTVHLLSAIARAMSLPDARFGRAQTSGHPESGAAHDDLGRMRGDEDLRTPDNQGSLAAGQPGGDSHTNGDAPETREPETAEQTADDFAGRRLADTEHGGLLYFVNLLARMGLIEAMLRDERWFDRGLRWVLHQLAVVLTGSDATDPAVLAFAGLMPGAVPPSLLQDPATDIERAAIDTLGATIARALRETMIGPAEPDAGSERALVEQVCRRRARIVAEPGWIEAHFSLEDVSLDIRRAGLDLNPEWTAWLGVVLRFVYA